MNILHRPQAGVSSSCDLNIEIIFIIDSSGSVADPEFDNWGLELGAVKEIVNRSLPVNRSRVGLINFSGCGSGTQWNLETCRDNGLLKKEFGLNSFGTPFNDLNAVYNRVDQMDETDFNGGYTWTEEALYIALTEFKYNSTNITNTQKYIILMTDGEPYPYDEGHEPCKASTGYVSTTTQELRDLNVTILAAGIDVSQSTIDDFFTCIVNDFNNEFFYVGNFGELSSGFATHVNSILDTTERECSYSPTSTTVSPTSAPTISPTESPVPDGPTPSPTNSDNVIFIDKKGFDDGLCNNETNSCSSLSYAYDCFLGNNGCDLKGYDGNGIINLGDGEWNFTEYDLVYDNEEIIINGNGANNTFLYCNDLTGIGCKWKKCWFELNNLTLLTDFTNNTLDSKQVNIQNGGTVIFNNVVFDGGNYSPNPLWLIEGDVMVTFKSCVFENNVGVFYEISNGADVEFVDCVFKNNFGDHTNNLFNVQDSIITIDNSKFSNNTQMRSFITTTTSVLVVIGSTFTDNQVPLLFDITNEIQSNTSNCSSQDNTLSSFTSNFFINNKVSSMITISKSSSYLNNNTIQGNNCSDYCISVMQSSVTIDIDDNIIFYQNYNFLYFVGKSGSFSTLCITKAQKPAKTSNYLSFSNTSNSNNTYVNFIDCMNSYSYITPSISSIDLSSSEQYYLNSIAGGSVLKSFECDYNSTTCGIVCNNSVSCFGSIFTINSLISIIDCGSNFACAYGVINASDNTDILESLHIICDEKSSCTQAAIYANSMDEFTLDCVSVGACTSITVDITNVTNSSIRCYQLRVFH